MIFQQFNLAKRLSVIENVLAGGLGYQPSFRSTLRIFSQEERRQALINLKRVGLLQYAYKRADELSGGEQQRVAIARAVANGPRLLLADEPTGNLDPHTAERVFDQLLSLVRQSGVAALVATHNLDLAARMDRVLRLMDGALVEEQVTVVRVSQA
jgi:ABC-type phosphate/phosphonate transport system ATPase subunit